jgi:hypothetical protein
LSGHIGLLDLHFDVLLRCYDGRVGGGDGDGGDGGGGDGDGGGDGGDGGDGVHLQILLELLR